MWGFGVTACGFNLIDLLRSGFKASGLGLRLLAKIGSVACRFEGFKGLEGLGLMNFSRARETFFFIEHVQEIS